MTKLLSLISKNIKILLRAKSSVMILLFAPLLIVFVFGIAFDTTKSLTLDVGFFSENMSDEAKSIMSVLEDANFNILNHTSIFECGSSVKKGEADICIVVPSDFSLNKTNILDFYVDYSRTNLVWGVLDVLSGVISEKSHELSYNMTAVLLSKLSLAANKTTNHEKTVKDLFATNTIIKSSVESHKTLLENISLSFDDSKYPVSQISSNIASIEGSVNTIQENLLSKITNIEEKVIVAKENTTLCFGTCQTNLELAITSLNTSREKTNDLNQSITDLSEVREALLVISFELEQTKSMISLANTKLATATTDLTNLISELHTASVVFENLENSIFELKTNLNNIQVTDPNTITNPILTNIKPVLTEASTLNYLFPTLIVILIMFISVLLSSTTTVMEKKSFAFFRNFVTPTKNWVFLISNFLTNFLIVLFQILIILSISSYYFKTEIFSNFFLTGLILLLVATFFILLGMALGYLFKTEETAIVASIFLAALFLILSSTFVPLEAMPAFAVDLANLSPFVMAEFSLKQSILFQATFSSLKPELLLLVFYNVCLFLFLLSIQKFTREAAIVQRHNLLTKIKSRFKWK